MGHRAGSTNLSAKRVYGPAPTRKPRWYGWRGRYHLLRGFVRPSLQSRGRQVEGMIFRYGWARRTASLGGGANERRAGRDGESTFVPLSVTGDARSEWRAPSCGRDAMRRGEGTGERRLRKGIVAYVRGREQARGWFRQKKLWPTGSRSDWGPGQRDVRSTVSKLEWRIGGGGKTGRSHEGLLRCDAVRCKAVQSGAGRAVRCGAVGRAGVNRAHPWRLGELGTPLH